jgi:acetolactate synthase-1/2/3 large subunit
MYTGADLIADFVSEKLASKVFLVTGGACAFMVDAIGRHKNLDFVCFQHEQSAAMAADAIWRTTGKLGVTMATSGPGATNLITGIACSWFDSIPSFHITGQVNQSESREALGANVRQAGFQETDIASIVTPITKWAHKISSVEDLIFSLRNGYIEAISGRMGPVLLDIPMNIQKAEISSIQKEQALADIEINPQLNEVDFKFEEFFKDSLRPLVIFGAGLALSGSISKVQEWCEEAQIPYVTSWGALTYVDRKKDGYQGALGVYGSRHANWTVQSADKIVVLGSRLDNRQRTGNPTGFAPFAKIAVLDIDQEELRKYKIHKNYTTVPYDLSNPSNLLSGKSLYQNSEKWINDLKIRKKDMDEGFRLATNQGELNPYYAFRAIQKKFISGSIVVSDCGANLCWVYQSYEPDSNFLFTAGGNSPMGYSLPAAIGAQLLNPEKVVYCFIGDGGLQMNVQELQTIAHYKLPIKIIIQNNFGYGIIKQFQDAYFEGRHFATGEGYSIPDFSKIAHAYDIQYLCVDNLQKIEDIQIPDGPVIIDMHLPSNSLITPKTEMDRFIHDQFPYIQDNSISELPFEYPSRPSELGGEIVSTV